jgi:hypothetical protein
MFQHLVRQPLFGGHLALKTTAAAVLLLVAAAPASAGTFGSLANFDVVNDTGHNAYGFEIEIEDVLYDHAGTISSVFGYDRVFSFISPDPGAVVRFGKPTVEYISGFGARITYGGTIGGEFTPSAPFVTSGESCWPGANANWKTTSCDHYGVSTYGSPAKTTYSWLVDAGGGTLSKQVVGVPAINIAYIPPAPNLPPAPVIQLQAQDLGRGGVDPVANNQNNAFWVKIIKTELDDNVELNDLLGGNHQGARPEIAGLDGAEVEVEWQPLQLGKVDEVSKSLDSPKPSVVYKFEFFNYQGLYDDDGYVDPKSGELPTVDANGIAFVTIAGQRHDLNFVGQQIAGFNVNEVAAVPEPQSWALMLAGLVGIGALAQRRSRRR